MSTIIREMAPSDLSTALMLWKNTEGVGLSAADSVDELERFLLRNPGLNYVAMDGSTIVGSVLCGHDGRRGYLHHWWSLNLTGDVESVASWLFAV